MASNFNEPPPSYNQVMNKVSKDLASRLQISINEETQASSSGPDQSSSSPPDELQTLLRRYEAAMRNTNLIEQDKSTLALAEYYKQAKNYDKGLTYFEKLYVIRLQILGPNSQSKKIASVAFNIGRCLNRLERYQQSLQWHQIAMAIWETQQPTLSLTINYNNHALDLANTGYYNEALKYYEKSLQVKNKLTSSDTEDKAITLYNIGYLYMDNLSNYTKSLDYYNKALTMYRNVYGTNTPHIRLAHCLHDIGFAHSKLKDYSKARTFYTEALDDYKEVHHSEPYHDDIELTTSNLGVVCLNARDYSVAEVYSRELVRISKVKYGRESQHEKLLQSYRYLNDALKGQKKMEEAHENATLPGVDSSPSEQSALNARRCVLS